MLLLCIPYTWADSCTNWTKILTFTVINFCIIYTALLLKTYKWKILSIKYNSVIISFFLLHYEYVLHHSILVNILSSSILIHSLSGVNKQQPPITKPMIFIGKIIHKLPLFYDMWYGNQYWALLWVSGSLKRHNCSTLQGGFQ